MSFKDITPTDFHAHILPNADHGSYSLETTLYQLSEAKAHGVERIIATPHFYPNSHTVEAFIKRRNASYSKLCPYLTEDMPSIKLGAEVLICDGLDNLTELPELFIQGTNTLLLELPFSDFSNEYCDCVYTLTQRGVNVVIAHAERYPTSNIEKLISNGAKLQLNAHAFMRVFKNRHIYDWIFRGHVVALGSDIHGFDKRAYADFVKAFSKLGMLAEQIINESDRIWNEAKYFSE